MAEELLAAAAIAALALSDDEAEESTGLVETEWSDGSVLGSYSVDGGTVDIISQTAQPGSVDEGLLRLAADAPAGRRYPDENRPGVLMNQPSGRKYRPSEIQKVADNWIDSIPEEGPNNPPGPDPGPSPGRPELPGGPVNPGGGLSDPGSFAPLVMNSNQPDLITGLSRMTPLMGGSTPSIGIETSSRTESTAPITVPVVNTFDWVALKFKAMYDDCYSPSRYPNEGYYVVQVLQIINTSRPPSSSTYEYHIRYEYSNSSGTDTGIDTRIFMIGDNKLIGQTEISGICNSYRQYSISDQGGELATGQGDRFIVFEEGEQQSDSGLPEDIDFISDDDGDGIPNYIDPVDDRILITPNLSSNFKTQIEALQAGEESCFKLAQGQGWTYLAGGKVLQLEEGGVLDRKTTPGVLALQINDGYTLRMICGVEGGFLGIQGAATSEIFDNDVIKEGDAGIGAVADAIIENEYADFIMMPGDSIQVDIDGISGVGDFRVTSKGREITDSYAVRNDVQFAIVPNSVLYREGSPGFTEDDIERRPKPDPLPDNGNGNGSSDRMSPLSVVLVLAGLGAFIYLLIMRRKGGGE